MTTIAPNILRQAIQRDDLLTPDSPRGARVVQITTDPQHAHCHVYMEAPVFTPDSRRFVYMRVQIDPDQVDMRYWRRQFWLCDIDDGFSLRQLTDHPDATAPAVSPDGRYLYYFVNERDPASRRGIRLRRVCLSTYRDETVLVIDSPLSGTSAPPSLIYPLATIRSDGGAIATGVFLGDGQHDPTWGLLVCDLEQADARIIMHGPDLFNPHPQYTRSTDPAVCNDLLVQENIGVSCDPHGRVLGAQSGCLLYVIRDNGSNLRVLPCGGDTFERCHGHQEWRGTQHSIMVGLDHRYEDGRATRPLVEAVPLATDARGGVPRLLPQADCHRIDVTRGYPDVAFGHTAFDLSGERFVGDWRAVGAPPEATHLYVGTLIGSADPELRLRYLLAPRTSYTNVQATHPHPFLSPDGKRVFFNSDYGGTPQIWMVDGFDYP